MTTSMLQKQLASAHRRLTAKKLCLHNHLLGQTLVYDGVELENVLVLAEMIEAEQNLIAETIKELNQIGA